MRKLLILAALLAGCAEATGPTPTPGPTPVPVVSAECATLMTPLVDALHDLNSRLSVGLSYQAYGEKLGGIRVEYDKVVNKADRVDAQCTTLVGSQAEQAMNEYGKAHTTWGDCIRDTKCEVDTIKNQFQANWATATDIIARIDRSMP